APGAEGDAGVPARDARLADAGRHPAAAGRGDRPLSHARLLSAGDRDAVRQRAALPGDRRPPQSAWLGAEHQPAALAQSRDRREVEIDPARGGGESCGDCKSITRPGSRPGGGCIFEAYGYEKSATPSPLSDSVVDLGRLPSLSDRFW